MQGTYLESGGYQDNPNLQKKKVIPPGLNTASPPGQPPVQMQTGGTMGMTANQYNAVPPTVQGPAPNAVGTVTTTGGQEPWGEAPAKQPGFYSPELEGLKHSFVGRDWDKMPEHFNKLDSFMDRLGQKTNVPVGSSEQERAGVYNLARRQIQGATKTAMDQMGEKLGARGWKAGDSGIADAILGKIAMEGAEKLGQESSKIAMNEVNNRFSQGMQLEGLDLAKLQAGGQMGGLMEGIQSGRLGMGLESLMAGGNLEQFAKQHQQSASQFGASHGLAQEKFGYGQEMDAINMLMGYGQYGQQAQQARYDPYYGGLTNMYQTGMNNM